MQSETIRVAIPVTHTAPIVLSPPLHGGPWAAVREPSWERGHRRVTFTVDGHSRIPGRFAVDFILLNGQGKYAKGMTSKRALLSRHIPNTPPNKLLAILSV